MVAEAKALREHAAIADMTAFAKIDVKGPDAYALLDRLCATRIPKKVGKISLGYLLTDNGRIEFEASITKMAESRIACFISFTNAVYAAHDRHFGKNGNKS